MTEQEYMDASDLARLRIVQKILVDCYCDVNVLRQEAYKAMRMREIQVNKKIYLED